MGATAAARAADAACSADSTLADHFASGELEVRNVDSAAGAPTVRVALIKGEPERLEAISNAANRGALLTAILASISGLTCSGTGIRSPRKNTKRVEDDRLSFIRSERTWLQTNVV